MKVWVWTTCVSWRSKISTWCVFMNCKIKWYFKESRNPSTYQLAIFRWRTLGEFRTREGERTNCLYQAVLEAGVGCVKSNLLERVAGWVGLSRGLGWKHSLAQPVFPPGSCFHERYSRREVRRASTNCSHLRCWDCGDLRPRWVGEPLKAWRFL